MGTPKFRTPPHRLGAPGLQGHRTDHVPGSRSGRRLSTTIFPLRGGCRKGAFSSRVLFCGTRVVIYQMVPEIWDLRTPKYCL